MVASLLACSTKKNDEHQVAQEEAQFVIDTLSDAELERLVQERDGNLLFLNLWATWCIPCREEFPDLVRLAEAYKGYPVEFVGLSIDYPDEVKSKIIPFLKEMDVNFKIYVQDFSDQEKAINHLNQEWSGALPTTFVYDSDAKQMAFLLGKHSYEEFKDQIEQILGNQAPGELTP